MAARVVCFRRPRQLEDENATLKQLLGENVLYDAILKNLSGKSSQCKVNDRTALGVVLDYQVSQRCA